MTFEEAVVHILRHEGGHVNDPKDPGGETKFGISKRAHPSINIASLTVDEAKAIYRRDYWDRINADALPPAMRLLVFDAAVNQGVSAALAMLQSAKGPLAIGQVPEKDLLIRYAKARLTRYRATKNFTLYGSGWLGRLMDVTIESSTHLGKIIA